MLKFLVDQTALLISVDVDRFPVHFHLDSLLRDTIVLVSIL